MIPGQGQLPLLQGDKEQFLEMCHALARACGSLPEDLPCPCPEAPEAWGVPGYGMLWDDSSPQI